MHKEHRYKVRKAQSKNMSKKTLCLCAFLPLCLFFYASLPVTVGNAETIDGIAAIVNDEIITHSELEERLQPYLSYIGEHLGKEEREKRRVRIRKEILDELIKEKLMLIEAKRIGITITDRQIESELSNFKERLNPAANFESLLAKEKLTEEEFRERLREQLLLRKVVEILLRGKIEIPSKEEAKQFFEENRERFREPRREAHQKEFADVRQEIESQLYRLRMEQALSKWVKKLQEKAYVKTIEN